MKKNNKALWIIGIIFIAALLWQGRQGLIPDDYLTYDDFLIQDASYGSSPSLYSVACADTIQNLYSVQDGVCSRSMTYSVCAAYFNSQARYTYSQESICGNNETKWKVKATSYGGNGAGWDSGESTWSWSPNKISLSGKSTARIESTRNFAGGDIKVYVVLNDFLYGIVQANGQTTSCSGSSASTFAGPISISGYCSSRSVSASPSQNYLLEAKSSRLDPTQYETFINGQSTGIKTVGPEGLKIWIETNHGSIDITNAKYKVAFSCAKGPNDMLAMESFAAGTSVSLYSTRYAVQSYCLDQPVIITSSSGSTTTAEPYQKWTAGETLTVPDGQTYTVFYVMHNDGSIPLTCSDAYDVKNNRCTQVSGIVQICSQGQFDAATGLCVVQPENICSFGRYDISQNKCIYNPSIQYVCEQGVYSSVSGKCEFTPASAAVCPSGTIWNPQSGFCEMFPSRQIICDPNFAYDATMDKCVKNPDTANVCLTGTYDMSIDKCVKNVPTEYSCTKGTLFQDQSTGVYSCIYNPSFATVCNLGVYDSQRDMCIYTANSQGVCSKGTLVNGLCQYEAQITCLQGNFDTKLDACVFTPDVTYLCLNGKLTTDINGKQSCLIYPESTVVCPTGCGYSGIEKKCVCGANATNLPQTVTVQKIETGETIVKTAENQVSTITYAGYGVLVTLLLFGLYYILFESGPKRGLWKKK